MAKDDEEKSNVVQLNDEKFYIIFAQCFDIDRENALAKMENSPISPCSYLQFLPKELVRWMQKPTVGDVGGLKRGSTSEHRVIEYAHAMQYVDLEGSGTREQS